MSFRMPEQQKQDCKTRIKEFFYRERGEEIGDLAADHIYQFVQEELGMYFYNRGVEDAKGMMEQKLISLEEDLESLKRIPKR
ncbi:uncharacterized protein (DUF2164 family) [Melghiribacillus thermohalophilus]|uniref:Uncharacterized protein (DUF2164 family) n=1 Tax=Melghiribacillus thermohalophilus TaxID=1324956 RepID=A0A4R3NHB0_9BACI|nr:DUF2164 domain-containing protein [Melghiribacillus thermohalophilus]TCT26858.1 uncharacterized protein (DUF2164 family) [Melghiribacillus thermohalophilus]